LALKNKKAAPYHYCFLVPADNTNFFFISSLLGRGALLGMIRNNCQGSSELELELIQTQMAQKPMLRAEVGMRVRCANKASAE
jgi:hypothetical protein